MLNLRACLTRVASRRSKCCADLAGTCAAQAHASHSLSAHDIAARVACKTSTAHKQQCLQAPSNRPLTCTSLQSEFPDHTTTLLICQTATRTTTGSPSACHQHLGCCAAAHLLGVVHCCTQPHHPQPAVGAPLLHHQAVQAACTVYTPMVAGGCHLAGLFCSPQGSSSNSPSPRTRMAGPATVWGSGRRLSRGSARSLLASPSSSHSHRMQQRRAWWCRGGCLDRYRTATSGSINN